MPLGTKRTDRLAARVLPDLLTVEEAAAVLRIGRNQAYDLTRQWRATGGQSGLAVVEFGPHTLRVPRHAIEALIGAELTGPVPAGPTLALVQDPADAAESTPEKGIAGLSPGESDPGPAPEEKVTPIRRRQQRVSPEQLSLFEPSLDRIPEHP